MPEELTQSEINQRNRELGEAYERQTYNKVKGSCLFAAKFGSNATSRSTPDVMCLQEDPHPKLRLIEAKRSGYIEPDQRESLAELSERSPPWVQLEVRAKTGPRSNKKRVIKKSGQEGEEAREYTEDRLKEFEQKSFDDPKLSRSD